jgi:putative DNA primase/helicase
MNMHILMPDQARLNRFSAALFKHADKKGVVSLRAFLHERGQPALFTEPVHIGDPQFGAVVLERARQAARHSAPAVFCPPVATFKNADNAKEENILEGVALSLECDQAPVKAREMMEDLLGLPTIIVTSGGEWVNPETGEVEQKVHLHWRLKVPARTPEEHKLLKEARKLATALIGGDTTNVPLVHPLRWPGSVHRKGEPRLADIAFESDNEIDLHEALRILRNAVGVTEDEKRFSEWSEKSHGPKPGRKVLEDALDHIPNDNPDRQWWVGICGACRDAFGDDSSPWEKFSARYPQYNPAETAKVWSSVTEPKATYKKILWEAKKHGWSNPEDRSEWPDIIPLPDGKKPVKKFDLLYLPAAIGPYVADIARRMQCPIDFVAVAALVGLGALAGNKIAIRPKHRDDWEEVPNQYGAVIGDPGTMKTPAFKEALKPLYEMEKKAQEENKEAKKEFKFEREAYEIKREVAKKKAKEALEGGMSNITAFLRIEEPEEPRAKRFIAGDCTYEALGVLLANNPNGILVHCDELVTRLKSLDQDDNAPAKGMYLSGWNGTGPHQFDRVGRGDIPIPLCCISFLGTTQPAKIEDYLRRAALGDDGLMERFQYLVWPDDPETWENIDEAPDADERKRYFAAFEKLEKITPEGAQADTADGIPFLRLDPKAQEIFDEWRLKLQTRLLDPEMPPIFKSHLNKSRKLVVGTALLFHLIDVGSGPVGAVSLLRAISLAEYLETHAVRAYSYGPEREGRVAEGILGLIKRRQLKDGFTSRDVYRKKTQLFKDVNEIHAALELLVDHNFLAARALITGGRTKTTYSINPKALA